MEGIEVEQTSNESFEPKLTLTELAITFLIETGKWTKFLSIMGFIFIGLIVVMGFFAGSLFSAIPGNQMGQAASGMGFMFGFTYVLMGLLYFFPTLYLYRFSQKLKLAIDTKNNVELETAFSNQKSFYKFWGILTAITLGLYLLMALVFAIVAAFV